MINPYQIHLAKFFETITDFKHTSSRLNKILLKDVENYSSQESLYFSGTSLIICDWTGPTENGCKINYQTGAHKSIYKEIYPIEIERLLSREFGFAFAQCFEALETLLKDIIFIKIHSDKTFRDSLPDGSNYSRQSLKGRYDIFKLIKKAGGTKFKNYSRTNNYNFRFTETFKIFSEVRHAITHSKAELKTAKIPNNDYYRMLFRILLSKNELIGEKILLTFEYKTLDKLLIYLAEFGFQIFKILSEEDKYDWKL